MQRQMFANGGQAVPNEYKGFSKLPENVQMRMDPAAAKKYAEGGIATMAPEMGAMMGNEEVMDPQVLQGMLNEASQSVGDLENAEDYETVINSIRGDDAPISARYEELASVVGEEDAAQTPESVLALTQPAIMMGAVDEGIGGLAQGAMAQPVEGAMAQGIMSTVAPPPPAAPMPPGGMGGPPPVNFNQGGLVRRGDNQPVKMMQAGGDPFAAVPGRLGELARERMVARQGIIGDPTAQLEEQQKLTKANMLFDIANTALAFAAPMQGETPGMSAAERLAMAAQKTQLLPTIGARAQQQLDAKKAVGKEKQALQLAALGSAETALAAQQAADAQAARDKAKFAQEEKIEGIRAANSISELVLKQQGDFELAGFKGDLESTLMQQKGLIDEGLIKLRNNKTMEADAKRIELQGLQDRTNILLRGTQALEELELKQLGAIAQIDQKHVKQLAIQDNQAALAREMKDIDVQLEEMKLMDKGAREANKNALEQKRIDLEERKVKVKEAAAGLNLFGKGTEGAILGIVSDEALLQRYAEGKTTQAESNILEQAINQFTQTQESVDPQTGAVVTKPGGTLVQSAQDAIKRRAERGGTLSLPAIATVLTSPETLRQRINNLQFNTSLFDADSGAVNLESDSWSQIPTTIVDNNIRYEVATGLPSGLQRIANYFSETGREIGFGGGLSARGKELSQADADLDTLRNRLLLEMTNLSEDRVLKFVQEDLATETNDLRGSAFKTDERIYAKLTALEKGLARQLQNLSEIVPEYGGDGRKYPKSVESARKSANNIKGLIAEVQGFKNIYEKALETQSLGLNDRQRAAARNAYKTVVK
jgi:hypothetical protein